VIPSVETTAKVFAVFVLVDEKTLFPKARPDQNDVDGRSPLFQIGSYSYKFTTKDVLELNVVAVFLIGILLIFILLFATVTALKVPGLLYEVFNVKAFTDSYAIKGPAPAGLCGGTEVELTAIL
jgi:hypothetical protein